MVSLRHGEHCFLGDSSIDFLSNFYSSNIRYKGHTYETVEHIFQTVRCARESDKVKIRNAASPKLAKIIGRFVEVRPNWEANKADVMEKILRIKFRKQSKLRRMLNETGDMQLINLNYWHDTFWGSCACTRHKRTGQNMLGAILMKIRAEKI